MNILLFFCASWALLLLCIFLWLAYSFHHSIGSSCRAVIIIIAASLLARIVPGIVLPVGATYDIQSYQIIGGLVLDRQDVYTNQTTVNRHPYLPLQMYWMGASKWLAEVTNGSFTKIVKLAPIVADTVIAILIFLLLRRSSGSFQPAFLGGLFYAINPVSVFVSAYHGQFDAIPLLCIMLSLWFLPQSPIGAGMWLGLGILDKSWPVLALPSICIASNNWPNRLRILTMTILIPLLGVGIYSLLFRSPWLSIIRAAISYNRGVGIWGYTYFFHLLAIIQPSLIGLFYWLVMNGRFLTVGALGLVWLFSASKQSPVSGILTILIAFMALTHAFAIQYLVWIIPFAILDQDRKWLTRYTLAAFIYMFLAYITLILELHINTLLPIPTADYFIVMPSSLPVWLVTIGWLINRIRNHS